MQRRAQLRRIYFRIDGHIVVVHLQRWRCAYRNMGRSIGLFDYRLGDAANEGVIQPEYVKCS